VRLACIIRRFGAIDEMIAPFEKAQIQVIRLGCHATVTVVVEKR
jgi:hypothetical protein